MKTCWIDTTEKPPIKRPTTINAIIYRNVVHAQSVYDRELSRAEVAALVKKLMDKKYIKSVRDVWSITDSFLRKMKKSGLLMEVKPEEE